MPKSRLSFRANKFFLLVDLAFYLVGLDDFYLAFSPCSSRDHDFQEPFAAGRGFALSATIRGFRERP